MKLAGALILRADDNKRLEHLKERLIRVAGCRKATGHRRPGALLLEEVERVAADLTRLIQQINRTNATIRLDDGRTIADAIAVATVLRLRHTILNTLQAAVIKQIATPRVRCGSRAPSTSPLLQQQADDLARTIGNGHEDTISQLVDRFNRIALKLVAVSIERVQPV